jgi:phosphoglycolate phosphatase-like HAD superfamily hydrolase
MACDTALIFDTDGTLLDARDAIVDAVAEGLADTYRHFDLPPPPTDRARILAAIGLPASRFFREASPAGTVPDELTDRFAGEFEVRSTRAEVAALRRGAVALFPGVEETLAHLAERGHPLLLFSNASAPYFDAVVEVHGLHRFFRRSLSLEEAVRQRAARDKTGMVRHLVADHPRAVVIGDRVHDVEAGRAAGARTVGCLWGFGEPGELSEADWLADEPAGLLALPLTR